MSDDMQQPDRTPISIQHPDCEHDASECRITVRSSVTMLAWEPVFDGTGNMTNTDPNTFVREFQCATCERTWRQELTRGGG
jgi:hypothetical protein